VKKKKKIFIFIYIAKTDTQKTGAWGIFVTCVQLGEVSVLKKGLSEGEKGQNWWNTTRNSTDWIVRWPCRKFQIVLDMVTLNLRTYHF